MWLRFEIEASAWYASTMDEPHLDPEEEKKRLAKLGEDIERERAQIDDEDPATEHRQTFAESGDNDEDDDENIAPG